MNYRQLIDQIDSSVAALNAMGLTCRDRVGLILPNGPVCAVAHFAVRSGMVCVPISADYRKAEYEKLISQLKISAIIVQVGQSAQAMTAAESCGVRVIRLTVSPDD